MFIYFVLVLKSISNSCKSIFVTIKNVILPSYATYRLIAYNCKLISLIVFCQVIAPYRAQRWQMCHDLGNCHYSTIQRANALT